MKDWISKINLGHILILISWLISSVWLAAELKTSLSKMQETVDKRMSAIENRMSSMETYYHDLNIKGTAFLQQHVLEAQRRDNNVDNRFLKMEDTVSKVSTIQNDVTWIKDYLSDLKDRLAYDAKNPTASVK